MLPAKEQHVLEKHPFFDVNLGEGGQPMIGCYNFIKEILSLA